MNQDKILFVIGPTCSGKTGVGVLLSEMLNGEVISADSMQIFDEIMIGTARPDPEELHGIPHHLQGFLKPDQEYSAACFQSDALRIVEEIRARGKQPIVVGGTGLYVHTLLYDINFADTEPNPEYRDQLSGLYDEKGGEFVHKILLEKDPESAKRIHPNDKKRLIRRLEILESGSDRSYDFRKPAARFPHLIAGISMDRALLYDRIHTRVDLMFENGLEQEARYLYDTYGESIPAFTAIGYKEFIPYFEGKISLEQVEDEIKKNTRHFAKRQLTWFRREEGIQWYEYAPDISLESIAKSIARDFSAI